MAKTPPTPLRSFLVECYWPGLTESGVMVTARRAQEAAEKLNEQGKQISYRSAFLVPDDEVAFCLFDASSVGTVEEACHRAELPFDRILSVTPINLG